MAKLGQNLKVYFVLSGQSLVFCFHSHLAASTRIVKVNLILSKQKPFMLPTNWSPLNTVAEGFIRFVKPGFEQPWELPTPRNAPASIIFETQHDVSGSGLELGPADPESSRKTIRPPPSPTCTSQIKKIWTDLQICSSEYDVFTLQPISQAPANSYTRSTWFHEAWLLGNNAASRECWDG